MTPDRSIVLRAAEWLLGLDQIRLGSDAPVYVQWNSPFPGWLILAFSLLVLLFITVAYWGERGRPGRRIISATLRAALVGLIIAMLCRPVLILQRNRVSPSHVALLIDTSASMARIDDHAAATNESRDSARAAPQLPDGDTASGFSRLDLARRALTADDARALRPRGARNPHAIENY